MLCSARRDLAIRIEARDIRVARDPRGHHHTWHARRRRGCGRGLSRHTARSRGSGASIRRVCALARSLGCAASETARCLGRFRHHDRICGGIRISCRAALARPIGSTHAFSGDGRCRRKRVRNLIVVDPRCIVCCPSFFALASPRLSPAGVCCVPKRVERAQIAAVIRQGGWLFLARIADADLVECAAENGWNRGRVNGRSIAGIPSKYIGD